MPTIIDGTCEPLGTRSPYESSPILPTFASGEGDGYGCVILGFVLFLSLVGVGYAIVEVLAK